MQVSKWGNSLAIRLPAAVVEALALKEGEEIAIHVVGERSIEISRKPGAAELLARLRKYRGRLPADFGFDRLEANEDRSPVQVTKSSLYLLILRSGEGGSRRGASDGRGPDLGSSAERIRCGRHAQARSVLGRDW